MNKEIEIEMVNLMKKEIERILGKSYCNTKEHILSYYDICSVFAKDFEQSIYKNLTSYLNRMAAKGHIIKASSGAGSYAKYTFPKDRMEKLIDEVMEEKFLV